MTIVDEKWDKVVAVLKDRFGEEREPDVKTALFVIGLRELGSLKKKFTKEEKQDLMNLAACKAFSFNGYFDVSHLDQDGWPVWKQIKPMPQMDAKKQEEFIREHIILYFEEENLL